MMIAAPRERLPFKRPPTSSTGLRRKSAQDGARIHPYISGQPHRIRYLEAIYDYVRSFEGVVHWNGEQILNWYRDAAR
jgi:hypothetical protein